MYFFEYVNFLQFLKKCVQILILAFTRIIKSQNVRYILGNKVNFEVYFLSFYSISFFVRI